MYFASRSSMGPGSARRYAHSYRQIAFRPTTARPLNRSFDTRARQADALADAVSYRESKPPGLSGSDLEQLTARVAEAIKIGNWVGNSKPLYNEAADKALVDIIFIAGSDRLIYTATFHRTQGVWKLRGVRETMQALLPPPVPIHKTPQPSESK